MSEELKSCPFCGSEDIEIKHDEFCDYWIVECRECEVERNRCLSKDDAIELWNTRPIEDEKDKEIAKLKAALKAFIKWDKDYPVGYNPMTRLHEFNSLITNAKFLLWELEKTSKDTDIPANATDINVGSITVKMEKEE